MTAFIVDSDQISHILAIQSMIAVIVLVVLDFATVNEETFGGMMGVVLSS
jgi:hypothetical protein